MLSGLGKFQSSPTSMGKTALIHLQGYQSINHSLHGTALIKPDRARLIVDRTGALHLYSLIYARSFYGFLALLVRAPFVIFQEVAVQKVVSQFATINSLTGRPLDRH